MATYMERNGRITAIVHIKPLPRTAKTFATAAEAERWANALEAEHRATRRAARPGARAIHPTTWYEIQRLPRLDPAASTVGIYFLFDGEECVYVGQSRQVHTRVREHRVRGKIRFTSYAWVPCQIGQLDELEKTYIDLLQPPANKMWTFERHRARYEKSTPSAAPEK
ncbi:GIY-YIG nuclease family protein [Bradyrhizobium cenepequi]